MRQAIPGHTGRAHRMNRDDEFRPVRMEENPLMKIPQARRDYV